jgi:hypothetical protein
MTQDLKESDLAAAFQEFNDRYFGGRLRKVRVRFKAAGRPPLRPGGSGHYDSSSRTIFIARTESQILETLLHEMCHIGEPHHGTKFRAKLLHLRSLGASVAAADCEPRLRGPAEFHIRHAIDDLFLQAPTLTWPRARKLLAWDLGLRPKELEIRAPWARGVWRNLRAPPHSQRAFGQ